MKLLEIRGEISTKGRDREGEKHLEWFRGGERRRRPQILFGPMENAHRMPRGVATHCFHPVTFLISLVAR